MKRLFALAIVLALVTLAGAQDWAKARLEKSPRHGEWVKVKNGSREVKSFVVYPEVKGKATSVVVIHEIFGLTEWVETVADQLAEAGYIAIAPDLLTGMGPGGTGSDKLGQTGARGVIGNLPPDQITADLNACVDYVGSLPAANGKVAVAGFCWGGGQTFRFATNNPKIKAGFVFYGSFQETEPALAKIMCPVYGFYGGNDNRINATIEGSKERMKKLNKTYEPVIYEGAGHGFMRAGEDPNDQPAMKAANKKAHDEAWQRMKDILKKL
jgi:carboxymethylenebutenolidase